LATAAHLKGLYAITDQRLLPGKLLYEATSKALAGGTRILQYRNKSDNFREQVLEACRLKILCHQHQALLLINDDVDLCQACDADGVHLGQSDTAFSEARDRLGPKAVIGVTCHNELNLVERAQRAGADYVAIGRFFQSNTKPDAPLATIDDLRRIRAATSLPIVAIGGITNENALDLLNAGADMLAVVHYLFSTPDVTARATALHALF
jgi:thiamine-phosphate pyrophosphorylase